MVLKVEFPKALEHQFREVAMRKYGFVKGSLKKASEEAIREWIREQKKELPKSENPIALIDGILSHVKGKFTSVELQHEAKKLWSR